MSLNAATIEYLLSKGLTGEDLLEVARRSEVRRDPTAAERQARFRAKQNQQDSDETRYVTRDDDEAKEKSPKPPKEKHPPITPKGVSPRRLPDDFAMPAEWKDWARDCRGWSASDIETEAANFCDYWQARGSGAAKLDWRKTWQTWVRNSKRPDGNHRNAPSSGHFDKSEYEARLAKIGRQESTGPPGQPLSKVVGRIVNQAGAGHG